MDDKIAGPATEQFIKSAEITYSIDEVLQYLKKAVKYIKQSDAGMEGSEQEALKAVGKMCSVASKTSLMTDPVAATVILEIEAATVILEIEATFLGD